MQSTGNKQYKTPAKAAYYIFNQALSRMNLTPPDIYSEYSAKATYFKDD